MSVSAVQTEGNITIGIPKIKEAFECVVDKIWPKDKNLIDKELSEHLLTIAKTKFWRKTRESHSYEIQDIQVYTCESPYPSVQIKVCFGRVSWGDWINDNYTESVIKTKKDQYGKYFIVREDQGEKNDWRGYFVPHPKDSKESIVEKTIKLIQNLNYQCN